MRGYFSRTEIDGWQIVSHLSGNRATIDVIAKAQLAGVIGTPAFDAAIVQPRTSVRVIRVDLENGSSCSNVDGLKSIAHVRWRCSTSARVAQAKLTVPVATPALQGGIVENCTAHFVTNGNGDCCSTRTKLDRWKIVAHTIGCAAMPDVRADTELTIIVETPAFHTMIVENGTCVVHARGNVDCRSPASEIGQNEVVTHGSGSSTNRRRIASTQLTIGIDAPTRNGPTMEERTCVALSQSEFFDESIGAKIDDGQIRSHFARNVATMIRIAQAGGIGGSPALDTAIEQEGAGCIRIDGNLQNAGARIIRTEVRRTIAIRHAGNCRAGAPDVANRPDAFVVRVGSSGNASACAIGPLALFGCGTSHASTIAGVIATNAIDAECRGAFVPVRARRTIGQSARAGPSTFATIAFGLRIRSLGDIAAHAVDVATF